MSMQYSNNTPLTIPVETPYRSAYSEKLKVGITFPEESPYTKQEFKDECDINQIMKRFALTGEMPNMIERAPQYLDATGFDYQEAQNFIAGANTLFNEMPVKIRERFNNSPAEFLDFCHDERNRPEMAEMGLLKPKQEWVVPYPSTDSIPPSNAPPQEPVTAQQT